MSTEVENIDTEVSYQDLKDQAIKLGIKVKGNPKKEDLLLIIEEAEEAAAIASKEAGYEKPLPKTTSPEEDELTRKSNARKDALRMVKCIITPLSEHQRTLPSEMYSVGNELVGFIKKVVKFNVVTAEPNIILTKLKETQVPITQKTVIDGKEVITTTMGDAFAIKELEFTPEELASVTSN